MMVRIFIGFLPLHIGRFLLFLPPSFATRAAPPDARATVEVGALQQDRHRGPSRTRALHLCPDGFCSVLLIVGVPDLVLTSRRAGKYMGRRQQRGDQSVFDFDDVIDRILWASSPEPSRRSSNTRHRLAEVSPHGP